ncbi:MAG: type I glyceraldehyde-3-phosphate dehydrogenase [Alphaproteobacteria bacterium]|nr:type I glyceraldehyde-3-phosphate dehydrogenase [Alphaproteobacteria bacterium]
MTTTQRPITIAINGFGRIGRLVMRALLGSSALHHGVKLVAINSPGKVDAMAHLFQYDSAHGTWPNPITAHSDQQGDSLDFGFGPVAYSSIKDPREINWGKMGVDIVLECSGKFNDRDKAALHLASGAKRVLVSAPSKGADKTIVFGVNHQTLTKDDLIVSAASCTTNCLAPVAAVLENALGIDNGFMTTIHAYTGDQQLVDNSHKDLRRARAAAVSMIPTSTGAAKSLGEVIPSLKGLLDGAAIRVPTVNVSCVDLVALLRQPVTSHDLRQLFQTAAAGPMKGVLKTTNLPLVSIDFNNMIESSCVDLLETSARAKDGESSRLVRVLAWYDNEAGFSHRMIDVLQSMGRLL